MLERELGRAVWVHRIAARRFRNGHHFRLAVDGGGRREHEAVDPMIARDLEEAQRAHEVHVEVARGLLDRLSHLNEPREVDDLAHTLSRDETPRRRAVADVAVHDGDTIRKRGLRSCGSIVEHHHAPTALVGRPSEVGSHEAKAARHERGHADPYRISKGSPMWRFCELGPRASGRVEIRAA